MSRAALGGRAHLKEKIDGDSQQHDAHQACGGDGDAGEQSRHADAGQEDEEQEEKRAGERARGNLPAVRGAHQQAGERCEEAEVRTGIAELDGQRRQYQGRDQECGDPSLRRAQQPPQCGGAKRERQQASFSRSGRIDSVPANVAGGRPGVRQSCLSIRGHLTAIETGLRRGVSSCAPDASRRSPPTERTAPAISAITRFNIRSGDDGRSGTIPGSMMRRRSPR